MKLSKAAKADAYDAVTTERCLWSAMAWYLLDGDKPDAAETVTAPDGDTYEFRLYGALRADGGKLLQIFRSAGQRPMLEAHRFDDWIRRIEGIPYGIGINTEVKIAAERLTIVRSRIYEDERARG